MKRKNPYIKIIIFDLILLAILSINSFVYNFLSNYYMIAFLVLLLIAFYFLFGFEKDNHRYTKDVIMNIVIYLLTFFILYYLLGILVTFVRNPGYLSIYGFFNFILRIALYIVIREYLRYQALNKCENGKLATVLTIILFISLDITNNFYFHQFNSNYNIFIFFALYLLPALGNNLLATYLSRKTGYRPVIFYMLVMELYQYILPITPNPDKYLASIIAFVVPMVLLYKQYSYFCKESDEHIERRYNSKGIPWLITSLCLTTVLVYFSSGYFRYHALAVGSGSMTPVILKGDVVVVEKIDGKYSELKVGDVIAFNYNGTVVVHRIINIIFDGEKYFFYTKGDANKESDDFVVEQHTIKGVVKFKIPYIGYPTVWLNNL